MISTRMMSAVIALMMTAIATRVQAQYVGFEDPNEDSFQIDVPVGWNVPVGWFAMVPTRSG